jgi:hypothetical protein
LALSLRWWLSFSVPIKVKFRDCLSHLLEFCVTNYPFRDAKTTLSQAVRHRSGASVARRCAEPRPPGSAT